MSRLMLKILPDRIDVAAFVMEEAPRKEVKLKLPTWKEASIWAVLVALLLELGINLLFRRSIWHRVDTLEEKVQSLEHVRELEELKTRQQLDELRHKAEINKQELDQIDEKVKKR